MSKLTLATLQVGQGSLEVLNANFQLIQTAFDNTLSRDGTGPNQIAANMDMNNFRLYNLPNAGSDNEPVTLGQLNSMATLVLYTPENHVHDWNTQITNKPATYAPSAHTHAIADITGLQTQLTAMAADISTLETQVYIFVQSSTPTAYQVGDLWFW